ncbi:MAG TPA: hypothetical protein VGQ73_02960, partial [Gemmatimonadales bacterium]|nr:hypothetical protein [Gemmatimonadales bacterium]
RLPAELDPSELIVGFLDTERAAGVRWSAADFNEKAMLYYEQHGLAGACRVSDAELGRIRALLTELIARWRALPPGETLELAFERAPHR